MGGFESHFHAVFAGGSDAVPSEEATSPPVWFGPPEDELGVVVPQSRLVGRSDAGVVALRYVTAFSAGLLLDLVAAARGLKETRAQALFHEQHGIDAEAGPADGFLRVGIDYPDGRQASNLAGQRQRWQTDREPDGPVLFQAGGGGGIAGAGRLRMNPAYWLWPLPPAGTLRLYVEWPVVEIELSSLEITGAPLVDAAARSEPLWPDSS